MTAIFITYSPDGYEVDYIVLGGDEVISSADAGDWTVILSLKDNENSCWADGTIDDWTFTWSIAKAKIEGQWEDNESYAEFVSDNASKLTTTYWNSDDEQVAFEDLVDGETYTAKVAIKDEYLGNYEFADGVELEHEFTYVDTGIIIITGSWVENEDGTVEFVPNTEAFADKIEVKYYDADDNEIAVEDMIDGESYTAKVTVKDEYASEYKFANSVELEHEFTYTKVYLLITGEWKENEDGYAEFVSDDLDKLDVTYYDAENNEVAVEDFIDGKVYIAKVTVKEEYKDEYKFADSVEVEYEFTYINPTPEHRHLPQLVKAVLSTCETHGNKEYYVCDECGLWFEDEDCTKEIIEHSSVELPFAEHDYTDIEWSKDDVGHWQVCSVCGELSEKVEHDHNGKDGACSVCGYKEPEPEPEIISITGKWIENEDGYAEFVSDDLDKLDITYYDADDNEVAVEDMIDGEAYTAKVTVKDEYADEYKLADSVKDEYEFTYSDPEARAAELEQKKSEAKDALEEAAQKKIDEIENNPDLNDEEKAERKAQVDEELQKGLEAIGGATSADDVESSLSDAKRISRIQEALPMVIRSLGGYSFLQVQLFSYLLQS